MMEITHKRTHAHTKDHTNSCNQSHSRQTNVAPLYSGRGRRLRSECVGIPLSAKHFSLHLSGTCSISLGGTLSDSEKKRMTDGHICASTIEGRVYRLTMPMPFQSEKPN
mmetsp:Transcript_34561/g.89605  ORF Transcript_34561/g.89605 Transcript_34561/m.89605 type:complete len:109 (-) Transcript_34561:2524-2850(-)